MLKYIYIIIKASYKFKIYPLTCCQQLNGSFSLCPISFKHSIDIKQLHVYCNHFLLGPTHFLFIPSLTIVSYLQIGASID